MKTILVWENKYGNEYWDASTPELKKWAQRELFDACKTSKYYNNCVGEETYERACLGDADALRLFLSTRTECEYERWCYESVREPNTP